MRRIVQLLAASLLVLMAPAWAGIASVPGKDLHVELVTYGPGRVYWERFGHDAIILRDNQDGESVSFNYGVFDFDTPHFFLRFIRGHLLYSMAAEYAGPEIASYIAAGRAVRVQSLSLTPQQASNLRDFLLWNLEPQHRHYRYDYFTDNCTTRIRDALNLALGAQLFSQTQDIASSRSYRGQAKRMLAHDLPLMILVDLGLGPYADRPLTRWQAAFLPRTLSHLVQHVQLHQADGRSRPLVSEDRLVYAGNVRPPPSRPPALLDPLLSVGLAGSLLVAWARRERPAALWRAMAAMVASGYALLGGLAGLAMVALWTLTTHRAAWANQNLFLFNPALLLIVWPLARTIGGRHSTSYWARSVAMLLAALSVAGCLGHAAGLFSQRNAHWIAFALPMNLVLAYSLRIDVDRFHDSSSPKILQKL